MNFSNNSVGFLSNGVYVLNLPPWPSKLCTLVTHHIFLTSCNTTNPRGLCAHPVLIDFQSPSQFNIWISCFWFSVPRVWNLNCQYLWIPVTSYFQTSSEDILFSVSLPPLSRPSCLVLHHRPHTDSSKTLVLYDSCTYLLNINLGIAVLLISMPSLYLI